MNSHDNPAFIGDIIYTGAPGEYRRNIQEFYPGKYQQTFPQTPQTQLEINEEVIKNGKKPPKERDSWGNGIEFLFSCVALSVGLGNVWRFPFIALENGGGLILYLSLLTF
jgi:hypothetical protein